MSSEKKENIFGEEPKSSSSSGDNTTTTTATAEDLLTEESLSLYPERRGTTYKPKLTEVMFFNKGASELVRMNCERKVIDCANKSPLVKLMMSALKSAGCEVDLRRHISCEFCDSQVTGGYDPELNQVVVCYNRVKTRGVIQGVLSHEFLHMFDYCRAKFDFRNLEHIACSEIRAANLMHCSFLSAMIQGSASPFRIAKAHKDCVKAKAFASVLAVRKNMPREEIWAVIDKVFDRCYNDLEPVGRRLRRESKDMERTYRERYHYGYYD